jgi:N-acetylglucosaminyldiphosphoundecaprenol N-acetyl-beta-D-mannosaminyltransferase
MTAISDSLMIEEKSSTPDYGCEHSVECAPRDGSLIVHEYANVLGVKVSAINMQDAVELATRWIESGRPGYVCVSSVHVIMEAQREPKVLQALNDGVMNTPDGMPLTWVGRLQGHRHMDRVFGPDFMLEMCRVSVEQGHRHFLYGGKPGVAEELKERLQKQFPGIRVVGTRKGVHRGFSPDEEQELVREIKLARPDIIWVGLGAPHQELFMAQYVDRFEVPLLVGVGAAFDYHTGRIRDCSGWVKRAGLQWLHRLAQEPRRLGKRYLINNPAFLWRIAWQLAAARHHSKAETANYPD